jgi:hypothetical protein
MVQVPGEAVGTERDDDVRSDLLEQSGCELEQGLAVDLRQLAVWQVHAPHLDEPEDLSGSLQLLLPYGRQGGPRRHARVADLTGSALVSETTCTWAPWLAYFAKVPPAQTVSSSG